MHFDRHARLAFVIALVTLVVGALGFRTAVQHLNVYLRKQPVPLRRHLAQIPRHLGPWQARGEDPALGAAETEQLGTDQYLLRTYGDEAGDRTIELHVAYYTGLIDAVPHIPDRCFVAAGWEPAGTPGNRDLDVRYPQATAGDGAASRRVLVPHPLTGQMESVDLPQGDMRIRLSPFRREEYSGHVLYGGYFFIANHRVTPNPAEIRYLAFQPGQRYAYFAKVQLSILVDAEEGEPQFLAAASDLVTHLLPHLMRCLPAWPPQQGRGSL